MAHEVGHNLGMEDDHNAKHGGEGNPCDGQGIMSYQFRKLKWTECSVKDFTERYR